MIGRESFLEGTGETSHQAECSDTVESRLRNEALQLALGDPPDARSIEKPEAAFLLEGGPFNGKQPGAREFNESSRSIHDELTVIQPSASEPALNTALSQEPILDADAVPVLSAVPAVDDEPLVAGLPLGTREMEAPPTSPLSPPRSEIALQIPGRKGFYTRMILSSLVLVSVTVAVVWLVAVPRVRQPPSIPAQPLSTASTSPSLSPKRPRTTPPAHDSASVKPSSTTAAPSVSSSQGGIECFEDFSELQEAVDAYLDDGTADTPTARRYGWPIGTWCIDRVTRLDHLFSAARNQRARFFNEDIEAWNISAVVDMESLFQGATEFNQNLSGWDTSKVENMISTFEDASSFNGNIGTWDVAKVRQFLNTFRGAVSLNQDLPWDVVRSYTTSNMFKNCISFNGNVSTLLINSRNLERAESMFEGAVSFDQDLSFWRVTPHVESVDRMFYGATAFNGDISSWDVSLISSFRGTFQGAASFNQDLSNWNVSSGRDFAHMFDEARAFNHDLCRWLSLMPTDADVQVMFADTGCESTSDPLVLPLAARTRPGPMCALCDYNSAMPSSSLSPSSSLRPSTYPSTTAFPSNSFFPSQAPSMSSEPSPEVFDCFAGTHELYAAVDSYLLDSGPDTLTASQYGWPIGSWCVSGVTSFASLFSSERNELARNFNEDISEWTTSSVTNMASVFRGNEAFNQDLSLWNTSSVATFDSMFRDATAFNGDLSAWDTGSARSLQRLFEGATSFDGRVGSWNTARVVDMERTFRQATAFNQDLSAWDVSKVQIMTRCFNLALSFKQDLSGWDVSRVRQMNAMFENATVFNGDVWRWNTSSLTNAFRMFRGASSFNQSLNSWTLHPDLRLAGMFEGAISFNGDISEWDVSRIMYFEDFLKGATSFNQDLSGWSIQSAVEFTDMFAGALSFRQDLCSWRFSLIPDARVDNMFSGTRCLSTEDPDLSMQPVSPLCFPCT